MKINANTRPSTNNISIVNSSDPSLPNKTNSFKLNNSIQLDLAKLNHLAASSNVNYRDVMRVGNSILDTHINRKYALANPVSVFSNANTVIGDVANYANNSNNDNVIMDLMLVFGQLSGVLQNVLQIDSNQASQLTNNMENIGDLNGAIADIAKLNFPIQVSGQSDVTNVVALISQLYDKNGNLIQNSPYIKYAQYVEKIMNLLKRYDSKAYSDMLGNIGGLFQPLFARYEQDCILSKLGDKAGNYTALDFDQNVTIVKFQNDITNDQTVLSDFLSTNSNVSQQLQMRTQNDLNSYSNIIDMMKKVIEALSQLYNRITQ